MVIDDTFLASDPSTEMNLEAAAPRMASSNCIYQRWQEGFKHQLLVLSFVHSVSVSKVGRKHAKQTTSNTLMHGYCFSEQM